jgi:7-cyano-7-deazaguanine synthase in queuosine biosynthesis
MHIGDITSITAHTTALGTIRTKDKVPSKFVPLRNEIFKKIDKIYG